MGASPRLSARLAAVVEALPLRPGIRVLEIGCGPGAAARAIAHRIGDGHVLAVDRSPRAVREALDAAAAEIAAGRMSVRLAAVEAFALAPGEAPFDLAFAVRVGALDGRHPELQERALRNVARALGPGGRLFLDGGDPLREVDLKARGVGSGSGARVTIPATCWRVRSRADGGSYAARGTPVSRKARASPVLLL